MYCDSVLSIETNWDKTYRESGGPIIAIIHYYYYFFLIYTKGFVFRSRFSNFLYCTRLRVMRKFYFQLFTVFYVTFETEKYVIQTLYVNISNSVVTLVFKNLLTGA